MDNLNIILPGVLVVIAFLLKLLVDRNLDIPNAIQATCGLPVDIIFLSLTFGVAFTISDIKNQPIGLFYCFIGIAISIIVVLLWRKSLKFFLNKNKCWILLLSINLLISSYSIMKSVNLIVNNTDSTIEKVNTENDSNQNLIEE